MISNPRFSRKLRCLLGVCTFFLLSADSLFAAGEADTGAHLYNVHCANCHDGSTSKAPHTDFLKMMAGDAIFKSMTEGVMRLQAAALNEQQMTSIAEHLVGPFSKTGEVSSAPMCSGELAEFDFDKPPAFTGWGLDDQNTRAIPDDVASLTEKEVKALKPLWVFAFPKAQRVRSQPGFAGGSLFVGSQDGTVYSLNARTGCIRWTFRARSEVRTGIVTTGWEKGDQSARPRLYFGDLNGRVYANDAITGENLWVTKVEDHPNVTVTASPILAGDKLIVPVSSLEVVSAANPDYACCTFRGSVMALDIADGSVLWKSFVIPEVSSKTGVTSKGTDILSPSGAPVWNTPAVDIEKGRVYFGSGENYSSPADGNSDAIIAISLETGKRIWLYQATANDAWNVACMLEERSNCPEEDGPDLDFGASVMLVSTESGPRVVAGQKSGVAWGMDPDEGTVHWKNKLGRGGIQAGIHFGMAALGSSLYIPISDFDDDKPHQEPARPGIFALDASDGRILWFTPHEDQCGEREHCDPGLSQPVTATSAAIFGGAMDGMLRAYAPATGEVIWEFDTDTEFTGLGGDKAHGGSFGGAAGPMVYDGYLYVSSGYGLYNHMPGNALIVFAPESPEEPEDGQ